MRRPRRVIWFVLLGLLLGPAGLLVHHHAAGHEAHECTACLLLASALAALPTLLVLPVLAGPVICLTPAAQPVICLRIPRCFSQRAPPV